MLEAKKTVFEICAGAGGQALGLHQAGFAAVGAVEIDASACATLRLNQPGWRVLETDVRNINGRDFTGVDLFAGGVPCPPFSIAGRQLGKNDERDLFPEALRLIEESKPRAILLENVAGFASAKFTDYRRALFAKLGRLGYRADFRVIQASTVGVPQLRPRFVLVAMADRDFTRFSWAFAPRSPKTVGEALADLMAARGWTGVKNWVARANDIAPTLVGGSKKHGGPDLGPTRAKKQWATLGVDGMGIANEAPGIDFPVVGNPRLTVRMAARIQGFPDSWGFFGKKTAAYRQIGNAFPPPVSKQIGTLILSALDRSAIPAEYPEPTPHEFMLSESTPKPRSSNATRKRIKKTAA